MIGANLAHYRIVAKLGEGGMGVVYRARDERLGREVAIKVLPDAVAEDPERLARFEREARLLASLSHQNIATLFGLEEHEGQRFLVMELAEGETLAQRIKNGLISVDDALDYAVQIAEGLEAAHAQGIVHRDLKPANVMLSPAAKIKVLDFGLAKIWQTEASGADLTHSPTLTADMTAAGVLLGTVAYMSPEQARGKPVDKRTDIWSFGCVLYEMLTGRRPFPGRDVSETIASILKEEPEWEALPASTPAAVRRVLRWCLEKDPDRRLHDIADARIAIEEAGEDDLDVPGAQAPSAWNAKVLAIAVVVAAVLGIVAGALGLRRLNPPAPAPVMAVHVETSDPFSPRAQCALSPDGRHLVLRVWDGHDDYLVHRRLDEFTARRIPGSRNCRRPFFSPDSQWVGYLCIKEHQLRKSSLAGGDPIDLCRDCGNVGTWSPDGEEIIVSTRYGGSVMRVSADGGEATVILESQPAERKYANSEFLPDGRAVLLEVRTGSDFQDFAIGVLDLETLELTTLIRSGHHPRYAPSGHLVFGKDNALYAVAFDAERRAVEGEPVLVRDGVSGWDLSRNGLLAWVDASARAAQCWLVWVNRQGLATRLFENSCQGQPRLSPDGTRVAMGDERIVVYDLRTGIAQQLTSEGDGWAHFPVWSPDGDRVAFADRFRGGDLRDDIYSIDSDFSGAAELLLEHELNAVPCSFSPSGKLVFQLFSAGNGDIWVLPAVGDEPRLIVGSDANEQGPTVSPDGRWLAYSSDRSGQEEVYVEPFPDGGARVQVSAGSGSEPRWSPRGDELFYRDRARMIAVPISLEPGFAITGQRQVLFENDAYASSDWHVMYDVDHDGQRFLMVERDLGQGQQPGADRRVNLITNWFEELERLVPTGAQ